MARIDEPAGYILFLREQGEKSPLRVEGKALAEVELSLNPLISEGEAHLRELRDMIYELSRCHVKSPWRPLSKNESAWLEDWLSSREAASKKERKLLLS